MDLSFVTNRIGLIQCHAKARQVQKKHPTSLSKELDIYKNKFKTLCEFIGQHKLSRALPCWGLAQVKLMKSSKAK